MKTREQILNDLQELKDNLSFQLKQVTDAMIALNREDFKFSRDTEIGGELAKQKEANDRLADAVIIPKIMSDKVCKGCGKTFTPILGTQKYCSLGCRNNFYHVKPSMQQLPEKYSNPIPQKGEKIFQSDIGNPITEQNQEVANDHKEANEKFYSEFRQIALEREFPKAVEDIKKNT